MQPNTISDKPTTLNLDAFRGNALTVRLSVAGSAPMPTSITTALYATSGGRLLDGSLQPVLSVAGRVITIAYPASTLYPSTPWHVIRFDGRAVLAGRVNFVYDTVSSPTIQDIGVRIEGAINVGVTVLIGASAGGSGGLNQQFVITNQTDITLTHSFGRLASVSFITSAGTQAGVSLTHTVNSVRLQSNTPVSGTLLCN